MSALSNASLRADIATRHQICLMSTIGRSLADQVSDALGEANLLLSDIVDDDDRESEDFLADMDELRDACTQVEDAYAEALAAGSENEQAAIKKNFELAVVGLRDKMRALEDEIAT